MFCSNCGTKNPDGAKFCSACGSPLQVIGDNVKRQESIIEDNVVGMTTEAEVLESFVSVIGMAPNYKKKYKHFVTPMIHALMPGEVIEFAFTAGINFSIGTAENCGFAMTNKRMLISRDPSALQSTGNASRGRKTFRGVKSYPYNTMTGVSYSKGLLLGTITVEFLDGNVDMTVDKKFVDVIYDGVSKIVYKYQGGNY